MADQGRWFKLWVTAPYDPALSNLPLDDFARWCLFGVYLKTHGHNGVIALAPPAMALQALFRLHTYEEVMATLTTFPSCDVQRTEKTTVTGETNATVTWRNWLKYQGDYSADRVRHFRTVKRTKKRGEEKRGSPPISSSQSPLPFDAYLTQDQEWLTKFAVNYPTLSMATEHQKAKGYWTALGTQRTCRGWRKTMASWCNRAVDRPQQTQRLSREEKNAAAMREYQATRDAAKTPHEKEVNP